MYSTEGKYALYDQKSCESPWYYHVMDKITLFVKLKIHKKCSVGQSLTRAGIKDRGDKFSMLN